MSRDEPKIINKNAEAYFQVWTRVRDHATNSLRDKTKEIVAEAENKIGGVEIFEKVVISDGRIGMPGLAGEKAFAFFSEIASGAERVLEEYCSRYTTDALVLHYNRDKACSVFAGTEDGYSILSHQVHLRFNRAVAAFAIPDNTLLPNDLGSYDFEVTEGFAVDMHVIRGFCLLKERILNSRRKSLYGGYVSFDENLIPQVILPMPVEQRVKIFLDRAIGGTGVFSRVGFSVPFINPKTEDFPSTEEKFFLAIPTEFRWNDPSFIPQYNFVSDVRLYSFAFLDIRKILGIMRFFNEPIQIKWGISSDEIVSITLLLSRLVERILFESAGKIAFIYELETKAVISVEESDAIFYLQENFTTAIKEICGSENSFDTSQSIERYLSRFALPQKNHELHDDTDSSLARLQDDLLVPFLFRAGDKFLLDLAMIPAFFSSLANSLELSSSGLEKKGFMFENQVRDFITSMDNEIKVIPSMERSFKENGIVVGEADVVVQKADTAFLIECKSHRAKSIDQSRSFSHAKQRVRSIAEWAEQARRTASYLASHPSGKNHSVPKDIRWIVPIVCTPMIEFVWEDNKNLFIIENELPINLTTNEISEFIKSERWKNNPKVQQYEVEHFEVLAGRAAKLAESGSLEAAAELLKKILPMTSGSYKQEILHRLGLILMRMKQTDEAIAIYQQGLELGNANSELLEDYGISKYYAGKYDEAIDAYEKAIKINNSHTLFVHLGNSLDAKGDVNGAINAYSHAIRIKSDYAPAYFNLGVTYQSAGNSKKAIEAYRKAIQLNPDYTNAFNNLIVLLSEKKEYSEAVKLCYQVLDSGPKDINIFYTVIAVLNDSGRHDEALVIYGKVLHHEGKLEDAVQYLADAISMNRKNFEAYYELGCVLRHGGNLTDAIESLRRGLKLNPKHVPALSEIGSALYEKNELDESWEMLKKAANLKIENARDRNYLVASINNLGTRFNAQKRFGNAITAFMSATALNPKYSLGYFNLGNSLSYVNKNNEAIDAYSKAIAIKPDYMEAFSNMGTLYYKSGQLNNAIASLRKALELNPTDLSSNLYLASSYGDLGYFKEAEECFLQGMAILNKNENLNINLAEKMLSGYAHLMELTQNNNKAEELRDRIKQLKTT